MVQYLDPQIIFVDKKKEKTHGSIPRFDREIPRDKGEMLPKSKLTTHIATKQTINKMPTDKD